MRFSSNLHIKYYNFNKLSASLLLLLLISGNLTELARLFFPTNNTFKILYYLLVPIFMAWSIRKLSKNSYCLQTYPYLFHMSLITILPLMLVYGIEFFLHIFLGLNSNEARAILTASLALLVAMFIIIPSLYKRPITLKEYISILLKPYIYFVLFTSIVILIIAPLVWFGIIDVLSWPIPGFFQIDGEFASGRINWVNMPMLLTFVEKDPAGVFRFQGLSQEPNTFILFSVPALFYWLYYNQELNGHKYPLILLLFFTAFTLSLSITFYIIISVLALLMVIRNVIILNKKGIRQSLLVIIPIVLIIYLIYMEIETTKNWISFKIESERMTGSNIKVFSEKITSDVLYGTGLLHLANEIQLGVGITIVYFFVLLGLFILSLKLFFSNSAENILGLGMIYYLLHGLKSPLHSFTQPFFLYLCVITGFAFALMKQRIREKSSL